MMHAMRWRSRGSLRGVAIWLALWSLLLTPLPGRTQASPPYRIAVLTPGLGFNVALEGLREGLAALGFVEGKNLRLSVEDTHGAVEQLAARATKIVATRPDLLLTIGTVPTTAARQATSTLPIVFAFVADPLRAGLVASHASSQNNLTGIANHAGTFSGLRLEILQEILPAIKRVLVPVAWRENVAEISWRDLAILAPKLGLELVRRDVSSKEDLEQMLQETPADAVEAIFHLPSSLVGTHMDLLIAKGLQDKLPVIASESSMVERGALMSYGADLRLLGKQAARLVSKILHGARPADIPIQTPASLVLAINLHTARVLGITIPASVLERADRVVE
ncbi:MAG: ABC transporter substrate-binding protein [Candidatus Tectimicrobiota bacterium]